MLSYFNSTVKECHEEVTNENISKDDNEKIWFNYILHEISINGFMEILINGYTSYTDIGSSKYSFCKTITKNELCTIIKKLCNKLKYKYFITTRSYYDSHNYFIVLSIIQNDIKED